MVKLGLEIEKVWSQTETGMLEGGDYFICKNRKGIYFLGIIELKGKRWDYVIFNVLLEH